MKISETPEFKYFTARIHDLTTTLQNFEKNVCVDISAYNSRLDSQQVEIQNVKKDVAGLLENQEKILYALSKLQDFYKEIYDERMGIADRIKNASHLMDKQNGQSS